MKMTPPRSWIKGFLEGEGSFVIAVTKHNHSWFRFRAYPHFRIDLHEKDKNILEDIKNLYGIGTVIPISNKRLRDKGINASDQYRYFVQGIKVCLKFRDELMKDPFYSSKEEDFKLWSEILDLLKEKEHLTIPGFLKVCEIRDKMNVSLSRKHPNYRDYSWFKAYFEENFSQNMVKDT